MKPTVKSAAIGGEQVHRLYQRTEIRGRKTEVGGQTTEDGVGVQRCSANWTTFTGLLSGS